MFNEISQKDLTQQLLALGVEPGGVLLVHASFRMVRPVEDGPKGLIAALLAALGPDGTLAMPSWTVDEDVSFDPETTPAAVDLGVVADTFWRLPGVQRCAHPEAFAAVGPRAAFVLSDSLPLPPAIPASPVGRIHEIGGQILLLGVGHDANTTLHLAEVLAGVPYGIPKHCTVLREGQSLRVDYVEPDHCCERFALMDDWLRERGHQSEGVIGHAHARLIKARNVVSIAIEKLAGDSTIFLHKDSYGCAECDTARNWMNSQGK